MKQTWTWQICQDDACEWPRSNSRQLKDLHVRWPFRRECDLQPNLEMACPAEVQCLTMQRSKGRFWKVFGGPRAPCSWWRRRCKSTRRRKERPVMRQISLRIQFGSSRRYCWCNFGGFGISPSNLFQGVASPRQFWRCCGFSVASEPSVRNEETDLVARVERAKNLFPYMK